MADSSLQSAQARAWRWLKSRSASPAQYLAYLQWRQADPQIRDPRDNLSTAENQANAEMFVRYEQAVNVLFPEFDWGDVEKLTTEALRASGMSLFNLALANRLVRETIGQRGYENTVNQTVVGELRLRELNACALQVPAGGFVIAVNFGLVPLLSVMSEICLARIAVFLRDTGKTFPALMSEDDAVQYVFAAIGRYAYGLNPVVLSLDQVTPSTRERMVLGARLQVSTDFFVLAHEYGHVQLGHLQAGVRSLNITGESVKAPLADWRQELEADEFAAHLLLERALRDPDFGAFYPERNAVYAQALSIPFAGPFLFLTVAELIEDVLRVLHRIQGPTSHPPAADRRRSLLAGLKSLDGPFIRRVARFIDEKDKLKEFVSAVAQLTDAIEDVRSRSWSRFTAANAFEKTQFLSGIKPDGTVV